MVLNIGYIFAVPCWCQNYAYLCTVVKQTSRPITDTKQPIKMNTKVTLTNQQKMAIRRAVAKQRRTISRGRSSHTARAGSSTPIDVIPGDGAPTLVGLPYLKTQFSNGRGFSKTLYTPSTLRIEVGETWLIKLTGTNQPIQ